MLMQADWQSLLPQLPHQMQLKMLRTGLIPCRCCFLSAVIQEADLTLCRVGNTMMIRTTKATIPVLIRDRNTPYNYALLECGADVQRDHLVLASPSERLMGRALTLCAFQIGLRKNWPEWGKDADIDMGLLQARGCKLSKQKHHLLYYVSSLPGDSGCALVLYDGKVVGMHLAAANTLVDNLDRAKELDAQMNEVAESIASFAASTSQLGIFLLCHAFTK